MNQLHGLPKQRADMPDPALHPGGRYAADPGSHLLSLGAAQLSRTHKKESRELERDLGEPAALVILYGAQKFAGFLSVRHCARMLRPPAGQSAATITRGIGRNQLIDDRVPEELPIARCAFPSFFSTSQGRTASRIS